MSRQRVTERRRAFSPEEDKYLSDNRERSPCSLAAELGRSMGSVVNRMRVLGIRTANPKHPDLPPPRKPPENAINNLLTQLWDKHLKHYRQSKMNNLGSETV